MTEQSNKENKESKESSETKMDFSNPVIYLVVGLLIGALATYAYINAFAPPVETPDDVCDVDVGPAQATTVDKDELAAKAVSYVNEEFLYAQGLEGKLDNVTEEDNVFEIGFTVYSAGEPLQSFNMYATKDGKKVILGDAFDISTYTPGEVEEPEFEAKSDAPVVEFYVMSFCPYGKQAEEGLGPVVEVLGDHATFEPHFVVYSDFCYGGTRCNTDEYCLFNGTYCAMHGINELNENVRQACVWKYENDKWWEYVNYVNANCNVNNIETCWLDAASNSGVDSELVQECFNTEAEDLLAAEAIAMMKYGVQGSPQVFINGVEHSGGRSPEQYKNAVCDAFNTPPEDCGLALSGEATAGGSCG